MGSADTPGDTSLDPCGDPNGVSGIFTFAGLISGGFLNSNGTAATGIDYVFDSCSQTVRPPIIQLDIRSHLDL
jgi:chitinase